MTQVYPELKVEHRAVSVPDGPPDLDIAGADRGDFHDALSRAVLEGEADCSLQNLEDIPPSLSSGLILAAVPLRDEVREAFISGTYRALKEVHAGKRLLVDTPRRRAQLLRLRPDLELSLFDGSLEARIKAVHEPEVGGAVVGAPNLLWLGMRAYIRHYFSPTHLIPAPGQGALGIIAASSHRGANHLLRMINHRASNTVCTAERSFAAGLPGELVVAAHAVITLDRLILHGLVSAADASRAAAGSLSARPDEAVLLGEKLAAQLLEQLDRAEPAA